MPGVTVHLHLAERSLDLWRATGAAPFPLADVAAVDAFRHGAFGPDLGYFPGGPAPLSDLAHAHRSGDLCRALVSHAGTPVERGFAWGWVCHVLADVTVHPLLGCAAGELVDGCAGRFMEGDRFPELHGRVEAGLDAVFAARYPQLRARKIHPVLDAGSVGFVQHAYEDTYGIVLDPLVLLRAHRGAARRAAQGLVLAGWNSRTLPRADAVRTGQGEGKLRGRLAKSSLVFAYLLPVRPPGWLLASVRSALRRFPRLLTESWRSRLEHLENRNLDTGRLETPHDRHGAFLRARRYVLAARAAAGASANGASAA
jgi:hypothetical protein